MFKLSTRGRYGTRLMMELALNYGKGPVPLKDVALKQDVSKGYLEHIIPLLRAAGLIKSVRGPDGGYILSREPEKVNLMDIIGALEGSLDPVDCISHSSFCSRTGFCVPRDIWIELKETVSNKLKGITLSDLVNKQNRKAGSDQTWFD